MAILQECRKCHKRGRLDRKHCLCGAPFPAFGRIFWLDVQGGRGRRVRVRLGEVGLEIATEKELDLRLTLLRSKGHKTPTSWGDIAYAYLAKLAAERAADRYQHDTKKYLMTMAAEWGDVRIKDLTPQRIRTLQVRLRERGLAPASVNRYLAAGKAAWSHATDLPNPFKRVKLYRLDNRLARYLTDKERHKLLLAAQIISQPLYEIICVALGTGLRKRNVLELRRNEVNFGTRTINVVQKGRRRLSIPMNDEIADLLGGIEPNGTPFFWINPRTNKPFRVDSQDGWHKVLQLAGINKPFRFHDLRHDAGTRLAAATGNLQLVKEFLGHRQIETTLRYAHVLPENLRGAAELLTVQKRVTKKDILDEKSNDINTTS